MTEQRSAEITVWDPFVRAAHWTIAIGFFIAYLTEDVMTVHVWAGYVVGVIVVLRFLWGFVGPRHARFADFAYGPPTVLSYLWNLVFARARRYVGHSPAGGAMVFALLLFLALTVATGLILYAEEEGAGPLAPFYTQTASTGGAQLGEGETFESDEVEPEVRRQGFGESTFEEVHEVIANATLGLVIFHILGVILASFVHHENLARAMVTGRKRRE
jgi:cytochrome b